MSQSHDPPPFDQYLRMVQQRIAQQRARVHRMIVQGTPTQAEEDQLRNLEQTLSRMKEQLQQTRASDVQRKIRDRRL